MRRKWPGAMAQSAKKRKSLPDGQVLQRSRMALQEGIQDACLVVSAEPGRCTVRGSREYAQRTHAMLFAPRVRLGWGHTGCELPRFAPTENVGQEWMATLQRTRP
jgi:hypothetical protein